MSGPATLEYYEDTALRYRRLGVPVAVAAVVVGAIGMIGTATNLSLMSSVLASPRLPYYPVYLLAGQWILLVTQFCLLLAAIAYLVRSKLAWGAAVAFGVINGLGQVVHVSYMALLMAVSGTAPAEVLSRASTLMSMCKGLIVLTVVLMFLFHPAVRGVIAGKDTRG